jgi:hypothetical protein
LLLLSSSRPLLVEWLETLPGWQGKRPSTAWAFCLSSPLYSVDSRNHYWSQSMTDLTCIMSRNILISMVSRPWAKRLWNRSSILSRHKNYLFSTAMRPVLGLKQPTKQRAQDDVSGGKATGIRSWQVTSAYRRA